MPLLVFALLSVAAFAGEARLGGQRVKVPKCFEPLPDRVVIRKQQDFEKYRRKHTRLCRNAKLPDFDFANRSLIGLIASGDCHARFEPAAYADDADKIYRFVVTNTWGGCRSARIEMIWLLVPKLRPDWPVYFFEIQIEGNTRRKTIKKGVIK